MESKPQQQSSESSDPTDAVLRRCSELLTVHDFASCRQHALAVYNAVPKHPGAIQALAIADVLIAARKRLSCGQQDFYSILQVNRATPPEVVKARAWKLLFYLNPTRNKFPLARIAQALVTYAWRALSDPTWKAKYDSLATPPSTLSPDVTRIEKSTDRLNSALGVKKPAGNPNFVNLVSDCEHGGHGGGGIPSNGNNAGEVRVEGVRQLEDQRPSKRMRMESTAMNLEPIPDLDAIDGFCCSETEDSGGCWSDGFQGRCDGDGFFLDFVGCTKK